MHKHEWLVDVCLDLEKYAHNEGMKDLEALLSKAVEAATLLVEGGASDTVQQTSLAAQELRVLISRIDRLTRELEQNPQGLVMGKPLPYEER